MGDNSKRLWGIGGAVVGAALVLAVVKLRQGGAPAEPPQPPQPSQPQQSPPAQPQPPKVTPEQAAAAHVPAPGNPPGCNDQPTSITVAPCLPSDIPGGATNATLSAAAVFAWQEFIALNWPSVTPTAAPYTRGMADPTKRLEDGQDENDSQLPTWATFRHKIEDFPGDGNKPHGPYGADSYYDDLPKYIYDPNAVGSGYVQGSAQLAVGQIPRCDDDNPYNKSENETFVTADEVSQISQNFMFAGKNEQQPFGFNGGDPKTRSQILFLVKTNRTYFDYIVSSQHTGSWWQGVPTDARSKTVSYLQANKADPPPGSNDMVSFPNGTIMAKSAWRLATVADRNSGRYLIKPVRYYHNQDATKTYGGKPGNSKYFCYSTNLYALVSLHIIQKTPSAPHFIYATFEQGDNILTADGRPIEDENGAVVIAGQAPLTPAVTAVNATPTKHQTFSPGTANCQPGSSLYYENAPSHPAVPQGNVCVRGRVHPIPSEIIEVNRQAHAAIDAYAATPPASKPTGCLDGGLPCTQNYQCCSRYCNKFGYTAGCTNYVPPPPPPPHPVSRWKYYKLVNIQAAPFDKPPGVVYQKQGAGPDPSTYYLANITVETNYVLQVFSGGFANGADGMPDGTITDYDAHGVPLKNLLYGGKGYLMGGCMGCHGVAQGKGGGFSFAFDGIRNAQGVNEGFNSSPEVAQGPHNGAGKSVLQRYDALFGKGQEK